MERFVAFVDILGFKEMVEKSKNGASDKIESFSKLIFDNWSSLGFDKSKEINGFIVSDCAIIYTNNDTPQQLDMLINLLIKIFPKAIFENDFLIRCAVTKGQFDELPAHSFANLSKKLIVGKAYVDATVLESKFKGANIVFGEDVHEKILQIRNRNYIVLPLTSDNENFYSIQWTNVENFMNKDNLSAFIDLANDSKWLPHYHETIHLFLKSIKSPSKKEEFWNQIYSSLIKTDEKNKINYKNEENFIIKAFSKDINYRYQQMFAKYLRDQINHSISSNEAIQIDKMQNNNNN